MCGKKEILECESVHIPDAHFATHETVTLPHEARLEAEPVTRPPEAKYLNCLERLKVIKINEQKAKTYFVTVALAVIYGVLVSYYVKATVEPEKYYLLDTKSNLITYSIIMVLFGIISMFNLGFKIVEGTGMVNYQSVNHIDECYMVIMVALVVTMIFLPFLLSNHYKNKTYDTLCDDYNYEIEIKGSDVFYDYDKLYTIKTTTSTDNGITVTTGPNDKNEMFPVKFGGISGLEIPYNYNELSLFDSQITSKTSTGNWYGDRAKISDMLFMKHPGAKDIYKICANNFGQNILQVTTIIPVLKNRYNTCKKCMERCMADCKKWDTRRVPYSYQTCNGAGDSKNCSTNTGWKTESYCAEYYNYTECSYECKSPACTGITL
jgi:hypothetical protein